MPCLIDTNVLIEALAGDATGDALERIKAALVDGASFSVITRMELPGWGGHTEQSRRATQALLDQLTEVGITPAVVSTVIGIRSNVAIKLPDAIIAASAITENLPLMTRNTKDFSRVSGLQLVDPFVG
jgi:predicted nucleic acid-binding protein